MVAWNGGNTHSGIDMGSLYTFGVPVQQLNELEMLYLVKTLRRGTSFKIRDSLINYKDAEQYKVSIKRELLTYATSMHEQGLFSKNELNKLMGQELRFVNDRFQPICQPSTRDFLNKQIQNVKTNWGTFQSSISAEGEQAMQHAINDFRSEMSQSLHKGQSDLYFAAIVVNISTGEILGQYGSHNIRDITTLEAGRNMGSLMKPFLVCELLERGFAPNQLLWDGPVTGMTTPQNYSRHYSYRYTNFGEALGPSLNAPFVNIRLITNPIELYKNVENRFAQMGIANDPYLDLDSEELRTISTLNYPLGSRNMKLNDIAQAYQCLFNEGEYIQLSALDSYYDPYKDTIMKVTKVRGQIYSSENANRVRTALAKTLTPGGTAYHLKKVISTDRNLYGKTGTTDGESDGYCVLSDGELLIVAYVSYGQVVNNHLRFGVLPIPFGSGGKSAGIFSANMYNRFSKLF